mmetsp:Transcript_21951/g.53844  ORF Transcript_21951/g.53844 Transcript_21951/m.53844 type:complete len:219 (-) Transcript_21951:507-1163(-)
MGLFKHQVHDIHSREITSIVEPEATINQDDAPVMASIHQSREGHEYRKEKSRDWQTDWHKYSQRPVVPTPHTGPSLISPPHFHIHASITASSLSGPFGAHGARRHARLPTRASLGSQPLHHDGMERGESLDDYCGGCGHDGNHHRHCVGRPSPIQDGQNQDGHLEQGRREHVHVLPQRRPGADAVRNGCAHGVHLAENQNGDSGPEGITMRHHAHPNG